MWSIALLLVDFNVKQLEVINWPSRSVVVAAALNLLESRAFDRVVDRMVEWVSE